MTYYLPIAEMPVNVLIVLALGAVVGFISGLFGIGGGFLMTPLLIFLGVPPAGAVATQTTQIVASSTTSVLGAVRRNALDLRLGTVLVAGGFVGSILGVWLFTAARRAGQLDLIILVSYVLLFTVVGSLMLKESVKDLWSKWNGHPSRTHRRAGEHAAYLSWPLRIRFPRSKLYVSLIPLMGFALLVGFVGALLGIGGGFMLVPALLYIFRVPAAVTVGTSQFQILCTTLVALILHAISNQAVDVALGVLLIIGGVFGAQLGARVGRYLHPEFFRFLLAILLLAVAFRSAVELLVPPDEASPSRCKRRARENDRRRFDLPVHARSGFGRDRDHVPLRPSGPDQFKLCGNFGCPVRCN
jgi:uncharacterized membrane protein YfcA